MVLKTTFEQHENIVKTIYDMLHQRKDSNGNRYYHLVDKNIDYGYHHNDDKKHHKRKLTGEVDVLAVKKEFITFPEYQSQLERKVIELYEVKTGSSKKKKARYQLDRAEEHLRKYYLSDNDVVKKYYVERCYNDTFDIHEI